MKGRVVDDVNTIYELETRLGQMMLLSRPVVLKMEIAPIRHRICESVISGIRGMECVCAMVNFLDMWLHSNPRPSTFTNPL